MNAIKRHDAYERRATVSHYSRLVGLQPPETTIIFMLQEYLAGSKVLDIGVGAGRTTAVLAEMVNEYVGIDSSEKMISLCMKRFCSVAQQRTFSVSDVRQMTGFGDGIFDFVLFSFNGLDTLSHSERLQALREIRRVGKKGGYFCFSSHNLQSIPKQFMPQLCGNPLRLMWRLGRWLFIMILNQGFHNVHVQRYALVDDGGDGFFLRKYYIKPQEQVRQLHDLGFTNVKVFELKEGSEVIDYSKLSHNTDWWVYYLCQI